MNELGNQPGSIPGVNSRRKKQRREMREAAQETEKYQRLKEELHEMGDVVTGAAAELYGIIRTPDPPPPKEDTSLLPVGEKNSVKTNE